MPASASLLDVGSALPEVAARLAREPDVLALYLYGSYGTDLQTPLSDVDLAIVTKSRERLSLEEEMRLRALILEALGVERVSITFLRSSGPIFQFEVLDTGRPLYVANEEELADFVAEVASRHADFRIDHDRFLEEYDQALREELGS